MCIQSFRMKEGCKHLSLNLCTTFLQAVRCIKICSFDNSKAHGQIIKCVWLNRSSELQVVQTSGIIPGGGPMLLIRHSTETPLPLGIRRCDSAITFFTLFWASQSCLSLQAIFVKENPDLLGNMDFNGTWQVYSQENYEEFLRAMGEINLQTGGKSWHAFMFGTLVATYFEMVNNLGFMVKFEHITFGVKGCTG